MVEGAEDCFAGGHAPCGAAAFFEYLYAVSCLDQGACSGDAGHAGADDGDIECHGLDSTRCLGLSGFGKTQCLRYGVQMGRLVFYESCFLGYRPYVNSCSYFSLFITFEYHAASKVA